MKAVSRACRSFTFSECWNSIITPRSFATPSRRMIPLRRMSQLVRIRGPRPRRCHYDRQPTGQCPERRCSRRHQRSRRARLRCLDCQRHRFDRCRVDVHCRRRHQYLQGIEGTRTVDRTIARGAPAIENPRGREQAACRRHSRSRAGRRPRVRDGLSLPRRRRPQPRCGQPEVHARDHWAQAEHSDCLDLCGPAFALEVCTEGKPVTAARAKTAGIIDAVIEGDLLEGAIALPGTCRGEGVPAHTRSTDKIGDRAAGMAACEAMRDTLGKTARGARAPFAAVDAIEACITMDFDAGSRREAELFADCVLSTESRAMRHLFFAEREVARFQTSRKTRRPARLGVQPSSAPGRWAAASR